jgi:hypothetical protein
LIEERAEEESTETSIELIEVKVIRGTRGETTETSIEPIEVKGIREATIVLPDSSKKREKRIEKEEPPYNGISWPISLLEKTGLTSMPRYFPANLGRLNPEGWKQTQMRDWRLDWSCECLPVRE